MIYKSSMHRFEEDKKYIKFKDTIDVFYKENNKIIDGNVYGTVCYVITKKGVEKLISNYSYKNGKFILSSTYFHVADVFLYNLLDTYVYKYNFIGTLDIDSHIHSDHLDFQKKLNNYQLEIIKKDFGQST
jgi:GR25 family glycosyltransferase involved in LPS biosynthesis